MRRVDEPYAFRSWPEPPEFWGYESSSAEWPEDMALELGDRVSEAWFAEIMMRAYAAELFLAFLMSD